MSRSIVLRSVKVVFANLVDEGFGTSITIDATDQEVRDRISKWVAENKIGRTNPGVANFKEYTPEGGDTTYQYTFKLNDKTAVVALDNARKEDLGFGSLIDLTATAFEYDNKFGKGVSQSLNAVLVRSNYTGNESAAEELLSAYQEEVSSEVTEADVDLNVSSLPF